MVQSINASNSNPVSNLIETVGSLPGAAIKGAKSILQPESVLGKQKSSTEPQKLIQNLIGVMSQMLETLKGLLSQFMQALGGATQSPANTTANGAVASANGETATESTMNSGSASSEKISNDLSAGSSSNSSGIGSSSEINPTDEFDDQEDLLPEEAANFRASTKVNTQKDPLQALSDDKGLPTVITEDGYTIHCDADKASWSITGPDGKTTQIWGDPHVVESDGDKWDFKNQSTFKFGNNKVTVQVAPYGDGSATVSSKITIYNGEQRVTIGGIDQAKAHFEASANDARTHDAALQDGDTYQRSLEPGRGDGEQWKKVASVQ